MAVTAGQNVRENHRVITSQVGGETPASQIKFVQSLPKGCSDSATRASEILNGETNSKGAATCFVEGHQNFEVLASVTRKLPREHIIQSFCEKKDNISEKRGIMVLFEKNSKSVKMFFNPNGTLESSDIAESHEDYTAGYATSYATIKVTPPSQRSCIDGTKDSLSAVLEADDTDQENQDALRIIANLDPNGFYDERSSVIADQDAPASKFSEVLGKASPEATIEHSQTIGDGVILTSLYKGQNLLGYRVFMRNEDGTCEVVGVDPTLATETALSVRQRFDNFAKNAGQEAIIVAEGKGKKGQ